MIKKLTAVGESLGIIIEQPILELLDIDEDTPLEVRTDGEALIIRPAHGHPARDDRRERVRQATERMMAHHDETLQKLAK